MKKMYDLWRQRGMTEMSFQGLSLQVRIMKMKRMFEKRDKTFPAEKAGENIVLNKSNTKQRVETIGRENDAAEDVNYPEIIFELSFS